MFDVSLCEKYYGMPAPYWTLAMETLKWLKGDALGAALTEAAIEAVANRSAREVTFAFRNTKEYVERICPDRKEGVFPAMFAASLDASLTRLSSLGYSDAMIRESLSDYGIWATYYKKTTGVDGFGELGWESRFITGQIVKIGRLQYEMCSFELPCTVYRCGGSYVPLMHAGLEIDENGFLAMEVPAAFTTEFAIDGDMVRGNRVDTARARVLPEMVALKDAAPVLTTGMPTLSLHIPETGEPLDDASVQASFDRARLFFTERGYPCELAMCESWLLDPAHQVYSAGGNICRFQARFLTLPIDTDSSDAVNRVFGRGTDLSDLDRLPEDTRMRRGLKDYLKSGAPLRDAGGIVKL